jgi:hypothetical protein
VTFPPGSFTLLSLFNSSVKTAFYTIWLGAFAWQEKADIPEVSSGCRQNLKFLILYMEVS